MSRQKSRGDLYTSRRRSTQQQGAVRARSYVQESCRYSYQPRRAIRDNQTGHPSCCATRIVLPSVTTHLEKTKEKTR